MSVAECVRLCVWQWDGAGQAVSARHRVIRGARQHYSCRMLRTVNPRRPTWLLAGSRHFPLPHHKDIKRHRQAEGGV